MEQTNLKQFPRRAALAFFVTLAALFVLLLGAYALPGAPVRQSVGMRIDGDQDRGIAAIPRLAGDGVDAILGVVFIRHVYRDPRGGRDPLAGQLKIVGFLCGSDASKKRKGHRRSQNSFGNAMQSKHLQKMILNDSDFKSILCT